MRKLKGYVNKDDVVLPHPDLSKVWLDSSDLMRLLHCSLRTINKLRTQGMPYYKVHTHYCLYKFDEVMEFIENRRQKPIERKTMINDFSYFRAPITNTVPHSAFSLLDAYHYITGGIAKETTAHLRTLTGKAHSIYKQNAFDFCTFSGLFSTRRNGDLLRHSSLVCFDFDHLPDVEATFEQLKNDKYFPTMLLFRSPSGDGLKWVISMERQFLCREKFFPLENQVDYHPSFFKSVSYYLLNEYGLVTDKSGKDIVRACFLPHDPNAYINEKILQ